MKLAKRLLKLLYHRSLPVHPVWYGKSGLKRFIIKKLRYFMSLKYPRHTIVKPLISGPPYLPIANELKIIHY